MKISVVLIISFICFGCSTKYMKRDSLSREMAFTKAFVFPFIRPNGDESEFSELAQEETIKNITDWKKFNVISFSQARRYLRTVSYHGKDYTNIEALAEISEKTGSDLVIVGIENKRSIEIRFYSTISGVMLFKVEETLSEKLNVHSIKAILSLVLRRASHFIPFDALVVATRGDRVKINAGRRNGLHPGSKVTVFEIISYRNEGDRLDYQRVPIARLGIVNLQQTEAIARVLQHNEEFPIERYNKVSFIDFFVPTDPSSYLDNF